MNTYKLVVILFILLIVWFYQCNIYEGMNHSNTCSDNPRWSITDKDGNSHNCSHIGKTINCYDKDAHHREAWEQCLHSCNQCNSATISKQYNHLAGISGEPIEYFGRVLGIDTDKVFDDKEDIVVPEPSPDVSDDIANLTDQISSMDSIFRAISGNMVECVTPSQSTSQISSNKFTGCAADVELSCPSPSQLKESKSYIHYDDIDHKVNFPPISISCNDINDTTSFKALMDYRSPTSYSCDNFILTDNKDQLTLGDMCPYQCSPTYARICDAGAVAGAQQQIQQEGALVAEPVEPAAAEPAEPAALTRTCANVDGVARPQVAQEFFCEYGYTIIDNPATINCPDSGCNQDTCCRPCTRGSRNKFDCS